MELNVQQFPYRQNDYWIGEELPAYYFQNHLTDTDQVSRDKLSIVSLMDDNIKIKFQEGTNLSEAQICGLLIDEWVEVIPNKEETTGISFNYDQPNAEAPQSILLAIPPKIHHTLLNTF